MEKLRIQQEQTLGTLETKKDAMMERRTKATMDRLDGLLRSRSGSKNEKTKSREPGREPRVNFHEQPNRRRHVDPLDEEAVHPTMPQGTIAHGAQTSEFDWQQTDLKRTTDARHTCDWEM